MSHADDRYYVPHDSHWPIVGSIGLLFLMVGVSTWLNGADMGFWVMLGGVAIVIFMMIGWFGGESTNFLNDPDTMLYSLILVDVWISSGFNMVIILAGLKNIPVTLYEAARMDGAHKLQEIFHITIPQLRPVLFFVITYGFISALQVFDAPWLLTTSSYSNYGGRENALLFPVMDMMGRGFGDLAFGEAAAYGFILTVVIVLITGIQFAIRKKLDWR